MNSSFVRSMAEISLCIVNKIKENEEKQTGKGLLSLLLTLCRNMEDVAVRNASCAAQLRANQLGLGDLRNYHWDDGGRFPGGRKESGLHWEHWKPAVDMRTEILRLENPSIDSIENILKNARVCWILLEENDSLNKNGHKMRRRDPELCYKEANIALYYDW